MTGIRRALVLIGLTLAATIGSAIPASAGFTDAATVHAELATPTVQAPTAVSVTFTCSAYHLDATVTWQPSPTSRIRSYEIVAGVGAQSLRVDVVDGTSFSYRIPRGYVAGGTAIPVTVTTVTEYGWTKTSAPETVVTPC
jgi:hypothetical protein